MSEEINNSITEATEEKISDKEAPKTYRQKIAEFKADRNWELINSFDFIVTHIMNGVPQGYVGGQPSGENIGWCGCCGYGELIHHFTVKNRKDGREVNIGCECLDKVFGETKGEIFKKGIASLRSKIENHFKRPFKRQDIYDWLVKNEPELTRLQNAIVDENLKKDPQFYFVHDPVWENGELVKGKINVHEPWNGYAKHYELRARNYWQWNVSNFMEKDWSPDTMKSAYKKEAERVGFKGEPIKLRKLTQEERVEMNKQIQKEINEWIKHIKEKIKSAGVV